MSLLIEVLRYQRSYCLLSLLLLYGLEHQLRHFVKSSVLQLANEQLDISYVYRAIQVLLKSKKKITVDELLPLLETQLSSFPEIDISTRIFRCLGELEFLGIISAVRRRGNTALQVLQVPFSCLV